MSDALARGRELEGSGDVEGAVEAYVEARAASEAARVLAMQGRLEDAGHAILRALGVEASEVGELPQSERELTKQAAAFFKSYRPELAEQIHEALAKAGPPPPEPEKPAAASAPAPPRAQPRPEPAPPPEAARRDAAPPPARSSAPPSRVSVPSNLTKPLPDKGPGRSSRPPSPGGSFRPPSVVSSGSFRAPVRGGGDSLRSPTSSGGFRPPTTSSGSGLKPPRKGVPSITTKREAPAERPAAKPEPEVSISGKTPRPSSIGSGAFTPPRMNRSEPEAKPAEPSTPASARAPSSGPAAEARATHVPQAPPKKEPSEPSRPTAGPTKRPTPRPRASSSPSPAAAEKRGEAKLSASGEVVTDYAGSRADGWRDVDPEMVERSIRDHLATGRKGAAARIARDAGQYERALEWFRELSIHYQAGACLRALGRYQEAHKELLGVDPDDPNYRKACFELVAVSKELKHLDFDTDRFLTRFIDQGPQDRDEIEPYLDLARLYSSADFVSGARRCAQKVLGLEPDNPEAGRLAGRARQRSRRPSQRIRAPRAASNVEGLPPLPSLEDFVKLAKEHAP